MAGGELAAGVVDVGAPPPPREPIVLRLAQLKRILGIEVEPAVVRRILAALGNVEKQGAGERENAETVATVPALLSPLPAPLLPCSSLLPVGGAICRGRSI